MAEIIKSENGYMDLANPVIDVRSPYSASYPVELLTNGLKIKLAQAENVAETIYRALSQASPMVAQAREAMKKGYRYVVDATDSRLEAIESGKIKLTTDHRPDY